MTRNECIDGMQRIIDEDRNKILVHVHVGYLIHAVKYLKDQAEIVRCEECKYRSLYCTEATDGTTLYTCNHPCANDVPRPFNWFCADGKKE